MQLIGRSTLCSYLMVLSLLGFWVCSVSGDITSKLNHYEMLHRDDIMHHHVSKRSADLNRVFKEQRVLSFDVLGRHFQLHLRHQRSLLGKDFRATLKFGNETFQEIFVDPEDFYEGYVQDDPRKSRVRAYFEGGDLVATVWTRDDVYTIEPSWRHLPTSSEYSMIAYKASDLILDKASHPENHEGASFCGYVHADHDDAAAELFPPPPPKNSKVLGKRNKRQIDTHNTCPVMLVADYHFYDNVGGGSIAGTAKYMVGALSRVDAIYRATDFGSGYSDLGFEIQGLTIHSEPTDAGDGTHYNMQADTWDTSALLEAFGKNSEWGDYCLAHLFTYLAFSDGVLGLGWIASSASNQAGGICSPSASNTWYNTAWTSHANKYGNRLLTQESDLVTAHEFGHNWGSPHDPSTDASCIPDSASGGKYLMYTYSVSGYESNNDNFSPCSKRSVLAVLQNKASGCFTERSTSFCGNYVVEDSEECDAGSSGKAGEDPCCDADCQFKSGAVCSDANSLCCQNCQAAPTTYICSAAGNSTTTCTGDAYCDGSGFDCPDPQNKPDGTACVDRGTCEGGDCVAFCEYRDLISCICDQVETSCQYCCKDGEDGTCQPYGTDTGDAPVNLPDGKPCLQGSCLSGVCEVEIRSVTDRLWSVISNLSIDYILEFMRNNIVLATVVCSLVLYLPFCIVVYCIDRKRNKTEKETVEWHNKDNETLVSEKDKRVIRPTYRRKRPERNPAMPVVNMGDTLKFSVRK